MSEKKRLNIVVTLIYILVFTGLLIYNLIHKSWFFFDAVISIVLAIYFYYLSNKFDIGWAGLLFANLVVFCHDLGSFDAYKGTIFGIGYDSEVHFFGSCVGAILGMKIIPKSLNVFYSKNSFRKNFFLILSIISIVLFFGIVIEFIEFTGYSMGVYSTNMFSPTDLDLRTPNYLYVDTIGDLIANVTGALTGVIIYFLFHKKRKHKQ